MNTLFKAAKFKPSFPVVEIEYEATDIIYNTQETMIH